MTPILNALQRATQAQPATIEALRKIADLAEIDAGALYTLLDQMHIAGQVGRVSGMREGKPALAYWPLVELVPAAAPAAPAQQPRTHRLPPLAPKQHKNNWPKKPGTASAAPQPAAKEHTMRQPIQHPSNKLLAHITDHPGLTGKELNGWAATKLPDAPRSHIKQALRDLLAAQQITATGKTAGMRYFAAVAAARPAATKPNPATGKTKPAAASPKPAPNDMEHATKAAQCADLLLQDMQALANTRNPLVSELLGDMLPVAHQLKNKLARLAGHIQQLST